MTNFIQNIDPEMVAKMRSTTSEGDSNTVPLETIDSKTNQTAQENLKIQTDPSKCWKCTRKVGLLGFKCHCKYVFCSKHRHAIDHDCTFDYKAMQQNKLKNDLHECKGDTLRDRV